MRAFTALTRLRLDDEQLAALKCQGFVARERRGNGYYVYKLRFRQKGRQKVRYVGTDAALADRVRRELQILQAAVQRRRRLRRFSREARSLLRTAKGRLSASLEPCGFAFHGLAIRRKRARSCAVPPGADPESP